MGYAGLGRVREDWLPYLEDTYYGQTVGVGGLGLREDWSRGGDTQDHTKWNETRLSDERDLAATSQAAFERVMLRRVHFWLERFPHVEGVVLSGGCALNVPLNSAIHRRFKVPVYVPPAPNDGGEALGGAWLHRPPPATATYHHANSNAFVGASLWDGGETALAAAAAAHGARRLSAEGGPAVVADLLASGKVVAVVRGRSEFGPRALGHRSLLADPTRMDTKARLNKLKHREWWRPVAPMVAYEAVDDIFRDRVWSPYMSFAPRMRDAVKGHLPAIAHFDGTARVQTVTKEQDPWLHALLMAMKQRNGFAVLCNTSFNTKGKPIINRLDEALRLLTATRDLDYLLVDEWLFARPSPEVGKA